MDLGSGSVDQIADVDVPLLVHMFVFDPASSSNNCLIKSRSAHHSTQRKFTEPLINALDRAGFAKIKVDPLGLRISASLAVVSEL